MKKGTRTFCSLLIAGLFLLLLLYIVRGFIETFSPFLSCQVIQNPSLPVRDATPEDLIRSTKHVTLATAKAVAAGNSCQQDDIIEAANMGRKAVTEMLIICKVFQLSFILFYNSSKLQVNLYSLNYIR